MLRRFSRPLRQFAATSPRPIFLRPAYMTHRGSASVPPSQNPETSDSTASPPPAGPTPPSSPPSEVPVSDADRPPWETFKIEEHTDDTKRYVYFVHSNHRIDEKKVVEARGRRGGSAPWYAPGLHYLKMALLPKGYPHTVSSDYSRWHSWQACQQICSAFNGVMSTHALLTALGMGSSAGATGIAAVAQWVLKDGLGNLGKILFGWKYGSILDSESKQWRMRADIFFNVGVALEISTLFAPHAFLPLAVTANLAKGVAGVAGGATRASIVKSFLQGENMADVAAKAESQIVLANLTGMIVGISMLPLVSTSAFSVVQAVAVCTAFHLAFNYFAVKQVYLPTLNLFRMKRVMSGFLSDRAVPTRKEVADHENIILPQEEPRPYLRIGAPFREAFSGKQDAVNPIFEVFRDNGYLVTLNRQHLHIIFRKHATAEVVLQGLFHAVCIQHVLGKLAARSASVMLRNAVLDLEEEIKLLQYTQEMAEDQFPLLIKGMREQGWNLSQLLVDLGPTRLDWTGTAPTGAVAGRWGPAMDKSPGTRSDSFEDSRPAP